MIHKVMEAVERHQMFKPGAAIVVAVSGGADSMALLSVLATIREEWNLQLTAAHINHSLRGAESDRDELFVSEYCKQNGIEFRSVKTDVARKAKENGESVEECGRRIRYEFCASIYPDGLTATAHTQTDSVETILFNLARGTAMKGLCGIPPVRGRVVRPLIRCTRQDTEHYCSKNGIQFVTDSTNNDDGYSRNYIRHHIVPNFRRINPAFEKAVVRCSDSLCEDEELLSSLSMELLHAAAIPEGYDIRVLVTAHPALRKRALAKLVFTHTGVAPNNKHINNIDAMLIDGGTVQVSQGVTIKASDGVLNFPGERHEPQFWSRPLTPGVTATPLGDIVLNVTEKADNENIQKVHNKLLDYSIDYDKINGNLVARCRLPGDKIRFAGREHTSSVKKLLNAHKIPVEEREQVLILSDDLGPIWVEGFGISQRCSVSSATKTIMTIEIRRNRNA